MTTAVLATGLPDAATQAWYQIGLAHGYLEKIAGDPENTLALAGRLVVARSGWVLLEVPNVIARGLFQSLHEPGVELPIGKYGRFNAHISVMDQDEVAHVGGPEKITERGKLFHYQLGPVQTVVPNGWDGVSRVWFVRVHSPELMQLRRTYGLSAKPHGGEFDFHITFAVRRAGVLHRGPIRKG